MRLVKEKNTMTIKDLVYHYKDRSMGIARYLRFALRHLTFPKQTPRYYTLHTPQKTHSTINGVILQMKDKKPEICSVKNAKRMCYERESWAKRQNPWQKLGKLPFYH